MNLKKTKLPKYTYTGISLYLRNIIFLRSVRKIMVLGLFLFWSLLVFFLLMLVSQTARKSIKTSEAYGKK